MFQQIIIIGFLGQDPEMRYTPGGQAVANFSVATNRKWTGKDGQKKEETTWFRISAWGKRAEVCNQYLNKGSKVQIIGRMNPDDQGNPRVWSRNDGTPAASFEITADNVLFLDSKSDNSRPPVQNNNEPAEEEIPW